MSAIDCWLVRLTGDEKWDEWGDDWMKHVRKVIELDNVGGATGLTGPSRRLDWGSEMWEVSKAELLRLIGPRKDLSKCCEEHDRASREHRVLQDALIAALPDDARLGVVWVEGFGDG